MRIRRPIFVALLLALAVPVNAAASGWPCNEGRPRGSISDTAHPEENLQCQTIGRAFCMVEEDRLLDHPKDFAIDRAAGWISSLGGTGSHQKKNDDKRPIGHIADYVYAHDKMPPWTAYWYSVYTCGFDKRVPPDHAKAAHPQWDAAADDCLRRNPGGGDGGENQPLRVCLETAMNSIVAAAKAGKR